VSVCNLSNSTAADSEHILFIYSRSEAESPYAVGRIEFARTQQQTQTQPQPPQQRQVKTRIHNVKRFAASTLRISFCCYGDAIIGAFRVRSTQWSGIIISDFDEIWRGNRTQWQTLKTKILDFLVNRCPRYGSLNLDPNGPIYSDRTTLKRLYLSSYCT